MDLSHLFPSMEKLKLIQGIESHLLKRKRLANISIVIAVAVSLLQVLVDVIAKNYKIKHLVAYFYNFAKFSYDLITLNWAAARQYEPVWELAGFFFVLLFLVFYIILKRTKFLFKYSEEPFRYTFWVEPFKHVKDTESEVHKIDEDDRFHCLLHHDLMEKLNERIRRLSLLDAKKLDSKLKHSLSSHIHIEGHFTIRNLAENHCTIQLMPRIRIGPQENPVTLAKPIEIKLGYDRATCQLMSLETSSGNDPYGRIVEHLYSRIATEIYRQIKSDLNEKIQLFPSKYLRAVALFHEAEDFSRSNTIDAYEHAIDLYRQSLRCFDITFIPEITKFLIKYPLIWRFGINVQHTLARVQIGYAKCQLYRRIISALSGRYLNPLFEIRSNLNGVIASLRELHNRINPDWKLERIQAMGGNSADLEKARVMNHFKTSMAYLTFPKDSWKRFVFLRPNQALFERQKRIFFDANVVLSITHTHLESVHRAKLYLEDAKAIAPALSEKNALYLVACALSEPEFEKRIPLLSRAREIAPDFEIAQYMFANYSEMQFRIQDEINAARGISVINEYDKVLKINPGNIASLVSQGYLWWLLEQPDEARRKLEEGRDIKAIVSETYIGTLSYGLARIPAEEGDFDKTYDLFNEAVSADPGVGVYSLDSDRGDSYFRTSFFSYLDTSMLERYRKFKDKVETLMDGVTSLQKKKRNRKANDSVVAISEKTVPRVKSFVLNDYGNACLNYYHRKGDKDQLDNAIEAYEGALELNSENKMALFNLQNAYNWRNNPEDPKTAKRGDRDEGIECLKKATETGPTWPLAITTLAKAKLNIARENIKVILQSAKGEIIAAEDCKRKLEESRKKPTEFSGDTYSEADQQRSPKGLGAQSKKQSQPLKNDINPFPPESAKSGSPYYTPLKKTIAPDLLGLQKEVDEHLKKANDLYEEAKKMSQNYTEKDLPEIERIVIQTKLSSIYKGYQYNVERMGIENFLNQKENINNDRLDENDVDALMVWTEALSISMDQSIIAVKELFNYIQEEYYPENANSSLSIKDMYELRLLYYQIESDLGLETVDRKKDIDEFQGVIDSYSKSIETMIENWLGNDPNHWASLLWARDYFDENKYIQYLQKARHNAIMQNELGNIYVEKEEYNIAITHYEYATQQDSQSAIYECNLGRTFGYISQWDEMIQHCTRAVELRRDALTDAFGLDYYYEFLSEAYFKADRLQEFEEMFKKTDDFETEPEKKAIVYNRLGNLLANDTRDREATVYYQQAIEHDPQKPIYHCNMGITFGKLNEWDKTIIHCLQAIRLRKTISNDSYGLDYYYNFLAEGYFNTDRLKEFEDFLEEANDFNDKPDELATIYNRIANMFFDQHEYENAATHYQNAIAHDAQKPIYECNLGRTFGYISQWDEMIRHCTRAVELRRVALTDAFGMDYYYEFLAEAYFKADRLHEFEDILEKMEDFKDEPDKKASIYNRIANLLFDKYKDEEAIKYYKKAITNNSQYPIYECNLGRTYGNLGKWDEMIKHCAKAVEVRKNVDADSYELDYYYEFLAEGYVKADKEAEFDLILEETEDLKNEPNKKARVYNRMANLLFDKNKHQNAITYYQKAIVYDRHNPIYECNLGRTYGNLGSWDEMIQHCVSAVELRKQAASDPYDLDYYYDALAEGYIKADRLDAFGKISKEIDNLDAEPDKKAILYNNIGNWLFEKYKNEDAITYYQNAITHDSEKPIYECNLGRTYGNLDKWDEMIDHCGRAIELRRTTPDDPYGLVYYYSFLAEAHFNAGRLPEYEGLLESTQDFKNEPEEIGAIYNRIANLFFDKIKDAEAITFYKKALAHDSQEPIYECNLGRTYGNLGNWDEMIKHCERAVELRKNAVSDSYELDYYLHYLEEGYRKAGKIPGKKDTMQKAS
jgi:tetratricopeptide (TPR) repeat protein